MPDDVRFLSKGRFIDMQEARKRPIMAVGSILSDEKLAQTFDSDEEFYKWIDHTKVGERVREMDKTIALLRKREHGNDLVHAQKRINAVVARVTQDLNELAARHGLDPHEAGYELFLKATVERDPLEPPIFDPFLLYRDAGLKGSWLPIGYLFHVPDLRWLGWNDQASSVAVFGAGCLWQDVWFQGPRLLFWGAPWAFNLAPFGWDNRASSATGA